MALNLSDSPQSRVEKQEAASERATLAGSVALYLRLWTYGRPAQSLTGLVLEDDLQIAEMLRTIVGSSKGKLVAVQNSELLTAYFENGLQALSTAKALQQRLLTFQRKAQPQQVVPAILVCSAKREDVNGNAAATSAPVDILVSGASGQILVSETIYEQVKNAPALKFNPEPERESGGTGGPEAIYELLWTDESTYGHLRRATRGHSIKTMGRYEVREELGRGAMGVVYKAYDSLIGRTVALKTIEINLSTPDRDDLIERLKQEAKAAGGLDHPNIITIYDVGQEFELIYLSMQFIEGKTLQEVIAEGKFPALPTLITYADQILSAVGYAHARGVIHRDLKPANLMLTSQGIIKILDFGIAKVDNAALTQTGLVVGTPSHMAPEQVLGSKTDHRADIFALGSVFYELVTREKPFRGDVTTTLYKIVHEDPVAPSLINPSLPGGIDAIIRKALAKDPEERFQTCEELRAAFLEQAVQLKIIKPEGAAPLPVATVKPTPRPPLPYPNYLLEEAAPKRSFKNKIAIAAVTLLVIIGVIDWVFYTKSKTGSFPTVNSLHQQAPASPNAKEDTTVPPASGADASAASDPASSSSNPSAASDASANPTTAPKTATQQPPAPQAGDKPPAADNHVAPAAVTTSSSSHQGQTSATQPATQTSNPAPADKGQLNSASASSSQPADSSKAAANANSDETQPKASAIPKPPKKTVLEAPQSVDGFTRRDIPELMRQADAATGRGDYKLARYEYNLILKLNPTNAAARTGLRRVESAAPAH